MLFLSFIPKYVFKFICLKCVPSNIHTIFEREIKKINKTKERNKMNLKSRKKLQSNK
jgi:hypothetical protein